MIRCPRCSQLVVRDVTRCDCGYDFDGTEPEVTPTEQDAAEWRRRQSKAPSPAPPGSHVGSQAAALAVAVLVAIIIGPAILQGVAGPTRNWSGSLLPLILLPIVFGVLWLIFSVAGMATLGTRSGLRLSVAACIGIGFVLALVGTILIFASLPPVPRYGPGP